MRHTVTPGQDPQQAIDNALYGDTIVFQPGIYTVPPRQMGMTLNKGGINMSGSGAILDGGGSLHSWFDLGAQAEACTFDGFEIRNTNNGGIWSNSGGGRDIVARNCHIHHVGNRYDGTTIGICGIYTDSGARNFTVDGCNIHDIGRTNDAGNAYDQGIYSHGNLIIRGCSFSALRAGWAIQTADGFSGQIVGNRFSGPNQYPGKPGQIMLWGSCGPIDISYNSFADPRDVAVTTYAFHSSALTAIGNQVTGGATLGIAEVDAERPYAAVPLVTVNATGQGEQIAALAATVPIPPNMKPVMILAGAALLIYLIAE